MLRPILCLLLLTAGAALAQSGWNPELGIGLTLDKGNIDRNLFLMDFSSQKRGPIHEVRTNMSFSTETGRERESLRKADLNSKANLYYHPDLFFFGMLDVFHNNLAGIDYRIAPGLGAGVVLARKEVRDTLIYNFTANIGANPVFENRAGEGSITKGHYLLITEAEYLLDSSPTRLTGRLDYRPGFTDNANYLVDLSAAVVHQVSRRFSFSNRLKLKYDSRPLPTKRHADLTFVFMIGYKLH